MDCENLLRIKVLRVILWKSEVIPVEVLGFLASILFALLPLLLAIYWVKRRVLKRKDCDSLGLADRVEVAGDAVASVSTLYGSVAAGQTSHSARIGGATSTSEVHDPGDSPLEAEAEAEAEAGAEADKAAKRESGA